MMNNNKGFRVINGGLSNEEYAARQLRKQDLAVWGNYHNWDESIAEHILYYADEYEVERFLDYLEEDDDMSEANAPQLYAVNNDESCDDDITYLEYEVEKQEIIASSKREEERIAELMKEVEELREEVAEFMKRHRDNSLLGKVKRLVKKVFGA